MIDRNSEQRRDFFISYNRHDSHYAEWIAWVLEEAGYSVFIQAWDFRAGQNFVLKMQEAATLADRTIAVLSQNFLDSRYTQPEWAAAFSQDPTGEGRKLILIRVGACDITGLLGQIIYIDLVGLEEDAAKLRIVEGLKARGKPDKKPKFPASSGQAAPERVTSGRVTFPKPIPSNLNYRGSPHFRGRDDELAQIHGDLAENQSVAICALAGMGGIGKTELAIQYGLRHQQDYPGGICWLEGKGESLAIAIVDFARRELGLGIGEDLSPADALRVCWREWRGQALLIYDNVENYGDLKGFLPPVTGGQFRVLITSRRQPGANIKKLEIKVLSPGSALAVLRSLVGEVRIEGQLADAEALAKWLGYLPLALDLVGHYLAEYEDERIANLLRELEAQRFDAEALQDIDGDLKTIQGLFSAFQVSWQVLTPEAQQLGCRLSLFAPAEIPWSFVEAIFPESEHKSLQRLLTQQLLRFSLLERVAERSYEFHPLIREFFGVKLQQLDPTLQDRHKTDFCRAGIQIAKQIPQTVTLAVIAAVETTIPHLETIAQQFIAHIPDENLFWAFTGIAWYYEGLSAWAASERWKKQCLETLESQLGADHPDVATSLNNLAELYRAQGRYSEAEPLYLRSLSIWESQLGADHPQVATSLNNLANLYRSQGRYSEAEPLYLRSLSIRESQLGANYPDVAISLNNLAELYRSQGRYSEAEPLYLRSLSIKESQLGADHPSIATSLNNLAALYESQGRYSEAEPLYLRSLSIVESQLEADYPYVASSLNNLAELYRAQGRYSEADPLYQKALHIAEQSLGIAHPSTMTIRANYAQCLKQWSSRPPSQP